MLSLFSRSRGRCLRFGGFELCERPLALRRQHASVELTAQPLRLLNLLASNAGRTVTHDEIRAALWEGRTVSYSGSTHVIIRQIRAALGDDADAPRFIETTPREGYRFVAPVTVRSGDWLLPACVAASAVIAALAVAGLTWQSHSPLVAETSEAVRLGPPRAAALRSRYRRPAGRPTRPERRRTRRTAATGLRPSSCIRFARARPCKQRCVSARNPWPCRDDARPGLGGCAAGLRAGAVA